MQKHTKIYMNHFEYDIAEDVFSELSGSPAQDIHHIHGRGKGKDTIDNLIALTREEHNDCHNELISKETLNMIHQSFIQKHENDHRKIQNISK